MSFTVQPLVFSMSEFQQFLRCRKSFQISHIMQLDTPSSAAAMEGTDIHAILADVANRVTRDEMLNAHGSSPMLPIVADYLRYEPLPSNILKVEEPVYTMVLAEGDPQLASLLDFTVGQTAPAVFVRTTFDLVYRDENDFIVGRDWKSFSVAPSFDNDLDFQGRTYTGALMAHYQTDRVRFEWKYIRREAPGAPRGAWDMCETDDRGVNHYYKTDAKGKRTEKPVWEKSDCYMTQDMIMSTNEVAEMWRELKDVARDLVFNMLVTKHYYRTSLKGHSPYTCGSCFQRGVCEAEFRLGKLSSEDIAAANAVPRDDAARMTVNAIIADPRVVWIAHEQKLDPKDAVRAIYGESGWEKFRLAQEVPAELKEVLI